MNSNFKQKGRKSNRKETLMKLLKSPAIMASDISSTILLPSNPEELCDRITLLLPEIHAGKILI